MTCVGDNIQSIRNWTKPLQFHPSAEVSSDYEWTVQDRTDIRPDMIVAGDKDSILEVLWKLIGIYVSEDDEQYIRRASSIIAGNRKSCVGIVANKDAKGEHLVLHVCKQIGEQLEIQVETMNDLLDGRVLAGAWRMYNINAPDIRLYPGDSLFLKVANAAASDFDVPFGLHNSIGLFVTLFLSRLFYLHELHSAAVRIQRAYRSHRFFKALKKLRSASVNKAVNVSNSQLLTKTYVVETAVSQNSLPRVRSLTADEGDELRNVLNKVRAKLEGNVQTPEEDRVQRAKETILGARVVKLQAIIRGHLARKRFERLMNEKKAAKNEQLRELATITIQSWMRMILAKKMLKLLREARIARAEQSKQESSDLIQARAGPSDDVFDVTQRCTPSVSSVQGKMESNSLDLNRVLQLQQNIQTNERLQKACSDILEACERKLSEEEQPKIIANNDAAEVQETTHRPDPTPAERSAAAVKLQAWYRGCRERARLHKHLQERRTYMDAYRGNIAAEEPSDVVDNAVLSSRPVYAKIHDAVDMLFDSKMYVSKVGAFILNRLSALSPHFCAYLVTEAQGLQAVLDIFEQKTTGRGPATAEILVILQEVFLRIVECTHPSVVAEVDANAADCVKIALHIFHAFYNNPVIVNGFGRAILALHRRPNAKKYFTKSPFYLNYATRRFARLPDTDPRKVVLLEMKSEMLSS